MEIMRFYKQKRILHKYVRWMYEMLEDGRFSKLQRAANIKDLPAKYTPGEKVRYLERMYHCADTLKGYMNPNTGEHKITHGFFCGDRVCPVCAIKKSLWEYSKLTWQMNNFGDKYTYYFLTLTLPNNPEGFRTEIDLINSILYDLLDFVGYSKNKSIFRLCEGAYGSFEITKSVKGWHPHLHLVLAYPKEYVKDSSPREYTDKHGKKRVFENGLVLEAKRNNGTLKKLELSHTSIMEKYIELITKKTDKYNDYLAELKFLNIGFQPCYNIEEGVNEMTKYLIDFEAFDNSDDLFVYLFDSYKMVQRVRRGIFRWNAELKEKHRDFLDELHEKENSNFIQ